MCKMFFFFLLLLFSSQFNIAFHRFLNSPVELGVIREARYKHEGVETNPLLTAHFHTEINGRARRARLGEWLQLLAFTFPMNTKWGENSKLLSSMFSPHFSSVMSSFYHNKRQQSQLFVNHWGTYAMLRQQSP